MPNQNLALTRLSYWSTLFCIFLGAAGAGVLCFFGITSVNTLPQSSLCMVLNEDFGGGIDTDGTWNQVSMRPSIILAYNATNNGVPILVPC